MIISELISFLETIAPNKLSYSWDNTGLLVGKENDEVKRVLLSLDVTPNVVTYALDNGYDTIVSHHPLFREPIKKINDPTLLKIIRNNLKVYTLHTNLDLVRNGVSKLLADRVGLLNQNFISGTQETDSYQIAIYVPVDYTAKVAKSVHDAGGGLIGRYSHCHNSYAVDGQFKPLSGSKPKIGEQGIIERVAEEKLEFFTDAPLLSRVIGAIHQNHPYETPVYAVYPQMQKSSNYGLGLIGELTESVTLKELALLVKERLNTTFVKLWPGDKNLETKVQKVAVCGGSGGSIIDSVMGKAEVLISADFTYHKVIGSKLPLIDAGHFHTENPVLDMLKEELDSLKLDIGLFPQEQAEINKLTIL